MANSGLVYSCNVAQNHSTLMSYIFCNHSAILLQNFCNLLLLEFSIKIL
jgi:hypothetical protein